MRALVRENHLLPEDFIYPLFIYEGENIRKEVSSMPGVFQVSMDNLKAEMDDIVEHGIKSVLLFGIPATKDECGTQAFHDHGIIQVATRYIKEHYPEIIVVADTCLCEYTSHGHCGMVEGDKVLNDPSLELLVKTAIAQAEAGADIIAPSNMMDGFVAAIRAGLDEAGFKEIPIMSYAVKYASAFYGPFREAAEGAPQFGDRKTYQMDTRTWADALQTVTDAFTSERPALVEPAALIDNYFDFAQQVLNKQREFAQSVVSVGAEAAQSVTEQTTAAAKTVAGTK
jgi:porphobilinogen synthase